VCERNDEESERTAEKEEPSPTAAHVSKTSAHLVRPENNKIIKLSKLKLKLRHRAKPA
jgi:hypothetical protein